MLAPHCVSGFRQSGDRSWRVRAHPGESAPAPRVASLGTARLRRRRFMPLAGCWPRCISHVTFPRPQRRTLIFVTALAVISSMVTALCIGYRFGRRWLDAFNLGEANESGGAKQARGQPAGVDDYASHPAELLAERVLPDAGGVWGAGGCSTRLSCGCGSSRRPGYPTVGAAGQIRESRGERPGSLGRAFRRKSGGHRRLPVRGVRDTGRRG